MKKIFGNQRYWRLGLIIFGAYTALIIVNLPQAVYMNIQREQPAEWTPYIVRLVWGMYVWVFITPVILWTGDHFRIAGRDLRRNILIHLATGMILGIIRLIAYQLGLWILTLSTMESVQTELSKTASYIQAITGAIITYPSIIAMQKAYFYFRESQERAFHLQQAELQMLKMQLHPHFFFNALNAISALLYQSPEKADELIVQLGDMFRTALKNDKTQEITLKEEVEFLDAFLHIHKTLMGKRLQIKWQIEPETFDALVPNLILQPLAENAIQHGLAPLERGGQITVSAARSNGCLVLKIYNDGRPNISKKDYDGGIGLANTKARLKSLYNGSHKFSIDKSAGGMLVSIEVPFRETGTGK